MRDVAFFSDQKFIPLGQAYMWKPEILWLNVISDGLIFLAYLAISVTLIYLLSKKPNFTYKWIFVMFSAFLILSGFTYVMNIWIIWNPNYEMEGFLKALTATLSVVTAVLFVPMALRGFRYINLVEIGLDDKRKGKSLTN